MSELRGCANAGCAPVRCLTVAERGSAECDGAHRGRSSSHNTKEVTIMGYGIGGILVLILVILAIVYFAKRV